MASKIFANFLARSSRTSISRRPAFSRRRISTAVDVAESPITPPVDVKYTQLIIDGKFVDSLSGKTFQTIDPRTEQVIADISDAGKPDVDLAVKAARKAFDRGPWPKMTAYERSCILLRFADLVEKHNDEIAAMETWDTGKTYEQASQMEIPMVVRLLRYFAGWADKIHGMTVPADGPHKVYTLHEPIGVAGQIIPWNFPLMLLAWKIGPALACGNTIVLKPAEQAPLTSIYAAKLLHEAGLPDGVLNIVPGSGEVAGTALSFHMDVDKIAFTGSTQTGKAVLRASAMSNLKNVTLELGGKSPIIVLEDADVDKAAELAHNALFFNQGQCCCAGSRTFVHESIYDEFVEKAKQRCQQRVLGDPFVKGVQQGPQIDKAQFHKILKYIAYGKECANLVAGGERWGDRGYYIKPTVFSEVQDETPIATDEIFGPVQSILRFKTLEEVIRRANSTEFGLAAGVFTNNLEAANTLSRALRVGSVWINCYHMFDAAIPFGGYKSSGLGREKGFYGLQSYLQVKAVVTPLKNPAWL